METDNNKNYTATAGTGSYKTSRTRPNPNAWRTLEEILKAFDNNPSTGSVLIVFIGYVIIKTFGKNILDLGEYIGFILILSLVYWTLKSFHKQKD